MMEMGGFSPGYLEDFDAYVRLADREKLGFVDSVVAEYRVHGKNVSRSEGSVARMRQALIKTCLKNMRGVRVRTALYLLIRVVVSRVQMAVGWGERRPVGTPTANS
jgi:hypothetical protein